VDGSLFEEAAFFRAIGTGGARALLIGRRALIALGIPVLTVDYHFWLHIDDIAVFNAAVEPLGLFPTHSFGARPKDLEDIRLLEALRREDGE
jgi:hypothetical protein